MRNSYYHFTKSQCTFSLILIRRLAARRGAGAGLPAHGRSRRMLATARRKPHVHSMWKRLAGRPTAGAGPSPPTSTRCKVPSFCIGRAFLPWIIRTRYGPQPEEEEKAACSLHLEALVGGLGPAPCEGRPARRFHSQGTCGFLIGLRPVPNANDPRRKRLLGAPSLESGLTHTSTSIVIFPP